MRVMRIDPGSLAISIGWKNCSDIRLIMKKSRNKYADMGMKRIDVPEKKSRSLSLELLFSPLYERIESLGHKLIRNRSGEVALLGKHTCICKYCGSSWMVHDEIGTSVLDSCRGDQSRNADSASSSNRDEVNSGLDTKQQRPCGRNNPIEKQRPLPGECVTIGEIPRSENLSASAHVVQSAVAGLPKFL